MAPHAGFAAMLRARPPAIPRLTYERLVAILLFTGIGAAACLMPAQSDTYWQLRSGQEMVAGGRVLLEDTFTHTVPGAYWPNHEWLSHVVFYLLWTAGGLPLLTACAAALVVSSWGAMWRLMPAPVLFRASIVLAVLIPTARLWSVRPQLISLFLLAVAMLLGRTRPRWLPLLFLVWANFHGGVMVGLAAVGGLFAGFTYVDRARWRPLALTLAACAAAVCVTPLGISVWTEIPRMLERLALYDVQEWRPASLADPLNVPFWVVALVLPALALRGRRGTDAAVAGLAGAALALLPLAIQSTRNIAPFLMLAAPALASAAPAFGERLRLRRRTERAGLNLAVAGAGVAASFAIVAYAWWQPVERLNWAPVSADVVRMVAACPGNIYNRYDEGGYLVWFAPRTPVFIDSRQDPFPSSLVTAQIAAEQTGDYATLFAEHDVRCAALPPGSRVARQLVVDGWQTRALDHRWVVLVSPGSDRLSQSGR